MMKDLLEEMEDQPALSAIKKVTLQENVQIWEVREEVEEAEEAEAEEEEDLNQEEVANAINAKKKAIWLKTALMIKLIEIDLSKDPEEMMVEDLTEEIMMITGSNLNLQMKKAGEALSHRIGTKLLSRTPIMIRIKKEGGIIEDV